MPNIPISPCKKKLFHAAIQMGDWLCSLTQLNNDQKQIIKAVQACFLRLPEVSDKTLAMYGFSLEQGTEQAGLIKGWDVSLEYFSNDPEQQGGFEVFSSYLPIPEPTDAESIKEKDENELYLVCLVGDSQAELEDKQVDKWCQEVAQPLSLFPQAERLRIEALFQQRYVEVIMPIKNSQL